MSMNYFNRDFIETMISDFFNWCVYVLEVIGDFTGMGYALANIVIFVILEPALILVFMFLWLREMKRNRNVS